MKKSIWLKPGKQLNSGAIVAIGFGIEAAYTFFSAVDCREKDKGSVSYKILWGTGAVMILLLVPAVLTILR